MFSKKATKIDEIFTVDLTVCSNCQIDGEDFVIFVAFLQNMNFNMFAFILGSTSLHTFLIVLHQ